MKKMKISVFCLLAMLLSFTACNKETTTANYEVIPLPQKIEVKSGDAFTLSNSTTIVYPADDADLQRTASFLAEYIKYSTGISLTVSDQEKTEDVIVLQAALTNENKEAYILEVNDKQVNINGATAAGAFYGVQTLRKSISADSEGKNVLLPQVSIEDYPRFGYRGMMLDVGRHMFPVEFIKEYIDILALHNINTLHWHISEDQGWRIEIKKHPKLTEIGSQRKQTVIGRNTDEYDGKPYGGFYTQEEAKEIVAYAKERFINVIPEIDLPGHMLGALKAYPHLGCTGGPYEVATTWGVFDDVLCAGNPETITFIEDVLTEIIDIFPSEYIHIGGDECPKVRWKECPKCQAKIKELGIKGDKEHSAEEKLQSFIINSAEKFVNSKGRRIIGWDEILEGGLAPNATVMSWRGMSGGIAAAKHGNDVIMVPTDYCYFDYYQTSDTENVPLSIGGYVPLQKVYSFEPVPSELTAEEAKHIIGAQANLWTEYIPTTDQVEYMIMPRIDALSEVQWTMPEKKDYDSFLDRLFTMIKLYDKKGYNYSKTVFDINGKVVTNTEAGQIELSLSTVDNAPIYYTTDGTIPTRKSNKYTETLIFTTATTVKAIAVRTNIEVPIYTETFSINKATMKPIKLNYEPRGQYKFGGALALVDGITGNKGGYKDGSWIGFVGENIEALIDLKEPTEISNVKVGTYICTGDWIFGSTGLAVSVSDDGVDFKQVAKNSYFEATKHREGAENVEVKFDAVTTRYVKILVQKTHKLPEWHSGKGSPAYIFIDEFQVN